MLSLFGKHKLIHLHIQKVAFNNKVRNKKVSYYKISIVMQSSYTGNHQKRNKKKELSHILLTLISI